MNDPETTSPGDTPKVLRFVCARADLEHALVGLMDPTAQKIVVDCGCLAWVSQPTLDAKERLSAEHPDAKTEVLCEVCAELHLMANPQDHLVWKLTPEIRAHMIEMFGEAGARAMCAQKGLNWDDPDNDR